MEIQIIENEIKEKSEQVKMLKEQIKALEKKRAVLRFGFDVGDVVLVNRQIFRIADYNGHHFEGLPFLASGCLGIRKVIYTQPEYTEKLDGHLFGFELNEGDIVEQYVDGLRKKGVWLIYAIEVESKSITVKARKLLDKANVKWGKVQPMHKASTYKKLNQ